MLRLIYNSYGLFVGVMILLRFLSGEGDLHGWLLLVLKLLLIDYDDKDSY